jgi:hypothetical protein
MLLVPAPRDERLPRLKCLELRFSFFGGSASSIDRRKSTFDSILVSSSGPGDGGRLLSILSIECLGDGNAGDLELASLSRKKSRLDSICVLTGLGLEASRDVGLAGSSCSTLGRPASSDGLEEEG